MSDVLRRKVCLICTGSLENIFCLPQFPVFMGCVNAPVTQDVFLDMQWSICTHCGTLQLREMPPLEIVYLSNHNEALGATWERHHNAFAQFVLQHGGQSRLEIGGATGAVAARGLGMGAKGRWLILEPNPPHASARPDIEYQAGWFDEQYVPPFALDTIIHSHVLEHAYAPREMLSLAAKHLPVGGRMIFSIPNLRWLLESKFTNALNFEHTYFLSDDLARHLVSAAKFRIIQTQPFEKHSIFFACERVAETPEHSLPDFYATNKGLFESFITYHQRLIEALGPRIAAFDGPCYLFGAHIFSQYLLAFGLKAASFEAVLDNSSLKVGQRLYGTPLQTKSPEVLRGLDKALIVLKTGFYDAEIRNAILSKINPRVEFC